MWLEFMQTLRHNIPDYPKKVFFSLTWLIREEISRGLGLFFFIDVNNSKVEMIERNNRMIRAFSIKSIASFSNDVRKNFFLKR